MGLLPILCFPNFLHETQEMTLTAVAIIAFVSVYLLE